MSDPTPTAPGPNARDRAYAAILPIFKIGLVAFLLLGIGLVVVQAIGIVTGNGPLVEGAVGTIGLPMTVAAAVTGLVGFGLSYLSRTVATSED